MGRPISERQRDWLTEELEQWQAAGLVAAHQRDAILACYESTDEASLRRRRWASFVMAALAATLVGLGALLIVGHNWEIVVAGWEALPSVLKLVVMLALIAGVQGAALHMRRNTAYARAADLLFLLGSLLYGAGIWLVAQVFHVSAHWPDGIWWWALGVLPLALLLDTLALHSLLVGLLALWVGGEILNFGHVWWSLLPNSCWSLPLFAAAGLAWCYRKGSAWGVTLYVALAAWWVVLQGVAWRWDESIPFFVATAGAMALIAAENHRPGNPLGRPYRVIGTLLAAGGLVFLSFVDFHEHLIRRQSYSAWQTLEVERMVVVVVLAGLVAVALALSALLRTSIRSGESALSRWAAWGRRQAAPLAIAGATVIMALLDGAQVSHTPVFSAIVANLAMIALAIWLMRVGIRDDQGRPFVAGMLYLLLWAVMRYVDLFGAELGMLGGAVMFILCGLGLFGLALVWRKRKESCRE